MSTNPNIADHPIVKKVVAAVRARGGLPTYLETRFLDVVSGASRNHGDELLLQRYLAALERPPQRFFTWDERQAYLAPYCNEIVAGTELDFRSMVCSQGTLEPFHWRGIPCFKSHFDMPLYTMLLQELRPRSIVELGAGHGASASFLSDLARNFSIETQIQTIDMNPGARAFEGTTFIQADCVKWLEDALARRDVFPRPLLVIEDFHAPLTGYMHLLDTLLAPGDYLVVEDAIGKQDEMARALPGKGYAVDARYTDFYGVNCTSAMNGFLKKMDDR